MTVESNHPIIVLVPLRNKQDIGFDLTSKSS